MIYRYHKLVRDNTPALAEKQGNKINYHPASTDEEKWFLLKSKLQEELDELSKEPSYETMADVMEVMDAIIAFKKFDRKELNAVRENIAIEKGTFDRLLVLEDAQDNEGLGMDQYNQ